MSYASVVEPLRAANLLAGHPLYQVVHFGQAKTIGARALPLHVAPDLPVGSAVGLDSLFVIAGGQPESFDDAATMSWLRRLAGRGVRLAGVSGGPVILAKAGVMAGRRMTVHWEHWDFLADAHPDLLLEKSLYVIDRDRVTCAGGTAPVDLMHALIAEAHGQAFARRISDWFMHTDVRPAGGPQRSGLVERVGTTSRPVLDAISVMETHQADHLTLEQLAAIAGVGVRRLTRAFKGAVGMPPMAYYRRLRLQTARGLLQGSSLSITEIALATGFASSSHFAQAYRQEHGVPPGAHRP